MSSNNRNTFMLPLILADCKLKKRVVKKMYYRETEDTMKTSIYVMETKLFKHMGGRQGNGLVLKCPKMKINIILRS